MDAAEQDQTVETGSEGQALAPSDSPLASIEPEDASPSDEMIQAVEAETTPPSARAASSPFGPLVWAGGGILVGALAMLLVSRLIPYRPSTPKLLAVPPAIQRQTPPTQVAENTPNQNPVNSASKGPEGDKKSTGVPPLDPFGTAHGLAIPPPSPIKGHIAGPILPSAALSGNGAQSRAVQPGKQGVGQPPVSKQPDKNTGDQTQPSKEPKNTVQLLSLSATVGDPDGARRQLSSWARKFGGTAQPFRAYDDKYESPVEGVLVFVPEAKLDEFMKFAEGLGSSSLDETWVGSSYERRSRLISQAESQLSALRKKKDELLKQYEDDATQVKHASEGIDIVSKSLGQLRPGKSTDGLEAVKVLLISKSAQAAAGFNSAGQ